MISRKWSHLTCIVTGEAVTPLLDRMLQRRCQAVGRDLMTQQATVTLSALVILWKWHWFSSTMTDQAIIAALDWMRDTGDLFQGECSHSHSNRQQSTE